MGDYSYSNPSSIEVGHLIQLYIRSSSTCKRPSMPCVSSWLSKSSLSSWRDLSPAAVNEDHKSSQYAKRMEMTEIEISLRFSLTVASQKKHSNIPTLSARKAKEELFMQFKSRRKNSFLSFFHASDMRNIISFPLELMNSNKTTEHDSLFKTWVMQWNFNLQLILLVHFSVLLQVHQVSQHSFSFHPLP